jgi:hypothetical protein
MKLEQINLGIVTIEYDEKGDVTSASFKPETHIKFDKHLLQQLQSVHSSKDVDVLKENIQFVVGGWWSVLNQIELADRDKYEEAIEIIECERYRTNMIKRCVSRIVFREISPVNS